MFVLLCLEPRLGFELMLITESTEPSAQLSVQRDSVEKPSSNSSKHLQKTSRKENEAVVTTKTFLAARNPQVPHTTYSDDLDMLQQHQRKTPAKTKSRLLFQGGFSLCCSCLKKNMEKHHLSHSLGKKREVHLFALRRHGKAVIANHILNKCVGVRVRRREDERAYT